MRQFLFVIVLLLWGCDLSSISNRDLSVDRAQEDARASMKNGDFRLLGVEGYSTRVPGTDLNIIQAERSYGVRIIERTGDVYKDGVTPQRNAKAMEYAKIYNETIVDEHLVTE